MAVFAAVALAALLFEDQHFLAAYMILYCSTDAGSIDGRCADGGIAAVRGNQVDLVKLDLIACFGIELVDEDLLTLRHFKLLTSDGNDRKHEVEVLKTAAKIGTFLIANGIF